ncbi:MAG: peptide deformylase, partial [Clostridium sp.]|nr:peptide deformylase [Clostridium sp.]
MALRNIRTYGDEILRKKCRKVDEVNDRLRLLIKDMIE